MAIDKRWRKWLIMEGVGFLSGGVTLFAFRSIPMASGTAVVAVVGLIAIKHLALAIAVASPLAALFQSIKPGIRARCPFSPDARG